MHWVLSTYVDLSWYNYVGILEHHKILTTSIWDHIGWKENFHYPLDIQPSWDSKHIHQAQWIPFVNIFQPFFHLYIISLWGGCIVGWINLEITFKFIFLLFRWLYYHIVLCILELLNVIQFEVIDFNIYTMQLIDMKK
jgi:hypothetical protein